MKGEGARASSESAPHAHPRSPRGRLHILPLAAALPVLAFALVVVVLFNAEQHRGIEDRLVQLARSGVQAVDLVLSNALVTVDILTALAESDALERQARRLVSGEGGWLAISLRSASGDVRAEVRRPELPSLQELDLLPAAEPGGTSFARARILHVGDRQKAVLVFERPVVLDDQRLALTAVLDTAPLSDALVRQGVPEGWIAGVLHPSFMIVGRSRARDEYVGTQATSSLISEIGTGQERLFYSLNKEGELVYTAFSTSTLTGFRVAVGAPESIVEAPLHRSQMTLTAGGVAAVLLAALLATILVRNVSRRQVSERRLVELEGDLRAERRLGDIAANFPGVIYRRVMTPDGRVSFPFMSKGAERLVGEPQRFRDPAPLRDLIGSVIHPDDIAGWETALHESAGKMTPYSVEGRLLGPDGTLRWVRSSAGVTRDPQGSVTWDGVILDITGQKTAERALREQTHVLQAIISISRTVSAELDIDRLVQNLTDAGTELCGAEFGAFFYNVVNDDGDGYTLYTLSGAPREAFSAFPMPRNTELFGPTFRGEGIVRIDDVLADPRFGKNPPYNGLPPGHLPVRSYLAVPVISRTGEVVGGLFFGHSQPGVFTVRAEQVLGGVAAHAAIAIDNARLYDAAQREIAQRRQAEEQQALLLAELNHRVRNTMAIVLAIAQQTIRHSGDLTAFRWAFEGRLRALAGAHTLLTERKWTATDLRTLVEQALRPFRGEARGVNIAGPHIVVGPKPAVTLSLVMHELSTNAAKYGALSRDGGQVAIAWEMEGTETLRLTWRESGGPAVTPPVSRGFGSSLIKISIESDLSGTLCEAFESSGYFCEIVVPWNPGDGTRVP